MQRQSFSDRTISASADREETTTLESILSTVSEGDVLSIRALGQNLREIKSIRLDARDVHPNTNQPIQLGTLSTIAATSTSSASTLISTLVSEGDVLQALDRINAILPMVSMELMPSKSSNNCDV